MSNDPTPQQITGSLPEPTFFEKAQLGVYAFVGGLTLDARLYSLVSTLEELDADTDKDTEEYKLSARFVKEALAEMPPIAEDV